MALEDDLQNLLKQQKALMQAHGAQLAILFTDIVGSTAYFEQRGDIAGMAMVKRHNGLLFPSVAGHQGRVVKTIGDSIMAVFENPLNATLCGAEMMRTLQRETWSSEDPIHIRIGIHWGQVLRDNEDVFGDAVNTAARINSAADPDEVLVSEELFRALGKQQTVTARPREVSAKGKAAPVPCVTVGWQGLSQPALAPGELFILELSRGPQGLRVAAIDGSAQKGTVKQYSDVPLAPDALDRLAESIAALAHGGGTAAYVEGLAVKGGELLSLAVPAPVRERLQQTQLSQLRLQLDDALTHVPWELMHDGAQALGLKFGIGRLVAARSISAVNAAEKPVNEGLAVVVANPSGDLPRAGEEGRLVARLLETVFPGKVELKEGPLTTRDFLALLPRARLLHFAGHVKKENEARPGGFVLSDGVVTPEAMAPLLDGGVPALVFANACHASTGSKWSAAGNLAQGLLLAGVRHVLAPLYGVPDADALSFALRFYEALLASHPYGEAARRAREALAESAGSPLSWAGYVLYGDPRGTLPVSVSGRPAVHDSGPTRAPRLVTGSNPAVKRTAAPLQVKWPAVAAAGLLLAGGGAFLALRGSGGGEPTKPVVTPPTKTTDSPKPVAAPMKREGSIRLSVLAFKSSAKNEKLEFMGDGISESMVSGLSGEGFTLVERTQLELDLNELQFSQSEFVDPQTRAALGKVKGAEVVVIGAWQASGEKLRLTARYVDVETGEILSTAVVDGTVEDAFATQDKLIAAAAEKLPALRARLRK